MDCVKDVINMNKKVNIREKSVPTLKSSINT